MLQAGVPGLAALFEAGKSALDEGLVGFRQGASSFQSSLRSD